MIVYYDRARFAYYDGAKWRHSCHLAPLLDYLRIISGSGRLYLLLVPVEG